MCFKLDETVTFLGPLPEPITPLPGPIGATLGTAMNNFNSSHKKVFEYYMYIT